MTNDSTAGFEREGAGHAPVLDEALFPAENPNPLLAADARGHIVYHNAAVRALVGSLGLDSIESLLPARHAALAREALVRAITLKRMAECAGRTLAWSYHPVTVSQRVHIYGMDITEHRRLEGALHQSHALTRRLAQKLARQDWHDPLTGLPNRRALERRLESLLHRVRDDGTPHALAHFDIDQFRLVNATYGHGAGDALLRDLAVRLRQCLRPRDMLAYAGEDEFTLVCEDCTAESAVLRVAALRAAIHELHFSWSGRTVPVTASVGVVPFGSEAESVGALLDLVDAACSLAKDAGRDHVHVYSPDDVEIARRQSQMLCASGIERALADGRFHLERHAIAPVQGHDGSGRGFELLLRMDDESGATIMPEAFLPAAERFGLATSLDRWVVETAIDWLGRQPPGRVPAICCINLSGQSLSEPDFMRFLARRVAHGRVPASSICFEITETSAIGNMRAAVDFIAAMRSHGCRFALDDFGTGMASFAYLRDLPVDFLKIDGSFVRDIDRDPVDFAMVKSINEIGHVMGKRTIAEFVETEAVLQRLGELKVDYAQGEAIAHPVPIAA